jgi:hypothetical protein
MDVLIVLQHSKHNALGNIMYYSKQEIQKSLRTLCTTCAYYAQIRPNLHNNYSDSTKIAQEMRNRHAKRIGSLFFILSKD